MRTVVSLVKGFQCHIQDHARGGRGMGCSHSTIPGIIVALGTSTSWSCGSVRKRCASTINLAVCS